MKKYLIAGNWKLNKDLNESVSFSRSLVDLVGKVDQVEIAIFPTYPCLYPVYQVIKDSVIQLGAQNLFYEEKGAYTGEVSATILKSVGCKYVIIGHSERRKYFNETDDIVAKKVEAALKSGLKPVICIGESLKERKAGITLSVIERQVKSFINVIEPELFSAVTIAYEPIWAIGTGETAKPWQAQEVHQFIRWLIEPKFGKQQAQSLRILYGGSVKPDNIISLMEQPDIDGALIGGASLRLNDFVDIINKTISILK